MKKTVIEIIVRHIRSEKIIVDSMPEETIKTNLADFVSDNEFEGTFEEYYQEYCKQRSAKFNKGLK